MLSFLPTAWWQNISFFGDSAFTVPGACVLALWLGAHGRWRSMLRWLWAFGVAMLLVVISKLLFMGWNIVPPGLPNFTGVSGHTASASAFYLGVALLLSEGRSAGQRQVAGTLALLVALAVGLSRLAIRVHSPSEVVTGFAIGLLAALWFWRGLRPPAAPLRGRVVLLVFAVCMLTGTGGRPAPTHQLLQQIALALSGHEQVYQRTTPL